MTAMTKPPLPPMPGTSGASAMRPVASAVTSRTPRRIELATAKPVTPKIILNAVEGFGKTTFAAHAPKPLILMAKGEAGYTTLLGGGRVPQIPAYTVETWPETLQWIDDLILDPQGIETLALDAIGGFERMCHEFICNRDFGNDWGEKGFASYGKGPEVSLPEWLRLLSRLESLNEKHGVKIILLSHCRVTGYKNPLGPDFDRFTSDVNAKHTWPATARWADCVLFGNYLTTVQQDRGKGKGKGTGGTERVIYTERRDAWDAKNRFGMSPEIWLDKTGPEQMWQTVWDEIAKK